MPCSSGGYKRDDGVCDYRATPPPGGIPRYPSLGPHAQRRDGNKTDSPVSVPLQVDMHGQKVYVIMELCQCS
jgi:hypothetical protein